MNVEIVNKPRFALAVVVMAIELFVVLEAWSTWTDYRAIESDGLGSFAYWGSAVFMLFICLALGGILGFLLYHSLKRII